jgi:hypothetical protein
MGQPFVLQKSLVRMSLLALSCAGFAMLSLWSFDMWDIRPDYEGWRAIKHFTLNSIGLFFFATAFIFIAVAIVRAPHEFVVISDDGIRLYSVFSGSKFYSWSEFSSASEIQWLEPFGRLFLYRKTPKPSAVVLATFFTKQNFADLVGAVRRHMPVDKA